MNCTQWQDVAALAVSGDVSAEDAAALEVHAAKCKDCRAWVTELENNYVALGELADFDFKPVAIPAKPRRRIWWLAAAAAAGILMLLSPLGERWKNRGSIDPPQFRTQIPEIPKTNFTVSLRTQRVRRKVQEKEPEQPLLVKMQTDDPQVVIYWLIDKKGE